MLKPKTRFKIKMAVSEMLIRLLMRLLYSDKERDILEASVAVVAGNPRIPAFEPNIKRGREYRRDEAAFQAWERTGMKQSRANLGIELTYWLLKQHTPEVPKRHHQQIGFEE